MLTHVFWVSMMLTLLMTYPSQAATEGQADSPAKAQQHDRPEPVTAPYLDTLCPGLCDLLVRMLQATALGGTDEPSTAAAPEPTLSDREFLEQFLQQAEHLRLQSQVPSACPCPFAPAAGLPKTADQPLTDEEMQEMLESAELLEAELETLDFDSGEPLDKSVLGSEEAAEACPFRYQRNLEERPRRLTVAAAPRDLVLAEESETPPVPEPRGFDVLRQGSRLVSRSPALRGACMTCDALTVVFFGCSPRSPAQPPR